MSIIKIFANTNYISINRDIIKLLGIHEALLIGELCSEYSYYESQNMLINEEWFYSTSENINNQTGLSKFQQLEALKNLIKHNIIEQKISGMPAKRHFKINTETLLKLLDNKKSKDLTTRSQKIEQQEVKKLDTNINNNINNNNNNIYIYNNSFLEKNQTENNYEDWQEEFIKTQMSKYNKNIQDCFISLVNNTIEEVKKKNANITKKDYFDLLQDLLMSQVKEVKEIDNTHSFIENLINIANETISVSLDNGLKINLTKKSNPTKENILNELKKFNNFDSITNYNRSFISIKDLYDKYQKELQDNNLNFDILFKESIHYFCNGCIAEGKKANTNLQKYQSKHFENHIIIKLNEIKQKPNIIQLNSNNTINSQQNITQLHIANMLGYYMSSDKIFYDFKNQDIYNDIKNILIKQYKYTYFDCIYFFKSIHDYYLIESKNPNQTLIKNSFCKDLQSICKDKILNAKYNHFAKKSPIKLNNDIFNKILFDKIVIDKITKKETDKIEKGFKSVIEYFHKLVREENNIIKEKTQRQQDYIKYNAEITNYFMGKLLRPTNEQMMEYFNKNYSIEEAISEFNKLNTN